MWCASPALAAHKRLVFWKGPFSTALEAASELHKPILLHFSTMNEYDERFDSVVYHDPDVVMFAGRTCLPFRVRGDALDSESVALTRAFHVKDFPTVIVLRSNGSEIDRMIGYQTPQQFLIYLQDFLNDTNTVGNLSKRLLTDTANLELALRLAVRYELRAEVDSAMWLMQQIVARGVDSTPVVQTAKLHLGVFDARAFGRTVMLSELFANSPFDSIRHEAASELVEFFQGHKLYDSVKIVYERWLERMPNDGDLLNDYAWFLTQQPNGDLARADSLSARAIAIDPKDAEYLDTRAEVFSRRHLYREAVETMEKAVRLRPGDAALVARLDAMRELMQQSRPKE